MPRGRHRLDGRIELELEQGVGLDAGLRFRQESREFTFVRCPCVLPRIERGKPAEIDHRRLYREEVERFVRVHDERAPEARPPDADHPYGHGKAEALAAFGQFSRMEGIIPALETAHAISWIMANAGRWAPDEPVLLCVSGRGDKDVAQVADMGIVPL